MPRIGEVHAERGRV
jgi:hypothetical protein